MRDKKDIDRQRMMERLQDEAWWDQMNQDALESMSEDDNEEEDY